MGSSTVSPRTGAAKRGPSKTGQSRPVQAARDVQNHSQEPRRGLLSRSGIRAFGPKRGQGVSLPLAHIGRACSIIRAPMSDAKPKGPRGTEHLPLPPPVDSTTTPNEKSPFADEMTSPRLSQDPEQGSGPYKPAGRVVLAGAAATALPPPSAPPPAPHGDPPHVQTTEVDGRPQAAGHGHAATAPLAGSAGVPPTVVADEPPPMFQGAAIPAPPPSQLVPPASMITPTSARRGSSTWIFVVVGVLVVGLGAFGLYQLSKTSKPQDKEEAKTIPLHKSGTPASATPQPPATQAEATAEAPPPATTPPPSTAPTTASTTPKTGSGKPRASSSASASDSSEPSFPPLTKIPSVIASTLQIPLPK